MDQFKSCDPREANLARLFHDFDPRSVINPRSLIREKNIHEIKNKFDSMSSFMLFFLKNKNVFFN